MKISLNAVRRLRERLAGLNDSDTCTCGTRFAVFGDEPAPERCWKCGKREPRGTRIYEVEVGGVDGEVVEAVPIGHLGAKAQCADVPN
jgi:hypothetical protein